MGPFLTKENWGSVFCTAWPGGEGAKISQKLVRLSLFVRLFGVPFATLLRTSKHYNLLIKKGKSYLFAKFSRPSLRESDPPVAALLCFLAALPALTTTCETVVVMTVHLHNNPQYKTKKITRTPPTGLLNLQA